MLDAGRRTSNAVAWLTNTHVERRVLDQEVVDISQRLVVSYFNQLEPLPRYQNRIQDLALKPMIHSQEGLRSFRVHALVYTVRSFAESHQALGVVSGVWAFSSVVAVESNSERF
jgi:hypothetical protein